MPQELPSPAASEETDECAGGKVTAIDKETRFLRETGFLMGYSRQSQHDKETRFS